MDKEKILFVSHYKKQCGVYEFGKNIFEAIAASKIYTINRVECNSLQELSTAIDLHKPAVIIYNYHPTVMPWLCSKISKGIYRNNINNVNATQIGIIHEVTQHIADTATNYGNKYILGGSEKKINSLFDFYIVADPTLLLKNPLVFKTGRLIPEYTLDKVADFAIPIIGSFGFATPNKGFQNVVKKVQEEFDEAIIRLNMPFAEFGDKNGENARRISDECKSIIHNPKIKLEITHDFLDNKELLDFLSKNSMNVFLYEDKLGRGISSAVDNALAVKRPITVSKCHMFRHILNANPSVCIEDSSLKRILSNGFAPLEKISRDWNKENIIWEYERIITSVLNQIQKPTDKIKMGIKRTIQSKINHLFSLPDKAFTWLRNSDRATEDDLTIDNSIKYQTIQLPTNATLNRILDNSARILYKPAIETLMKFVPKTMSKKIAEANVQQAFVFDMVCRFIPEYSNPKLLCVGSYEDTASMSLIKMGHKVEEIDPMLNYYLQEYYTKPGVLKNSYEIIFSTSVIEHDPDDKSFVECIEGLLAPGGIAIITCDYKDGWKQGDTKPDVDARFYTQRDLKERLLSYMPACSLVDEPQWECSNPDFNYLGKYIYTFASFVVKKNK